MSYYMKKPCTHCPFRNYVKPFLHPKRGEELAYHSQNPYNSFPCHKTTECDDDGETYAVEKSKECAGFITLQINEGSPIPEGFDPAYDIIYDSAWDMTSAYEDNY